MFVNDDSLLRPSAPYLPQLLDLLFSIGVAGNPDVLSGGAWEHAARPPSSPRASFCRTSKSPHCPSSLSSALVCVLNREGRLDTSHTVITSNKMTGFPAVI